VGAHGIPDHDRLPGTDNSGWPWQEWETNPRKAYAKLWDSIHGTGAWEENPRVWTLTFSVHHQNVDDLLKATAA